MNRRTELRINWNDSIQYRISVAGEYKTGIVRNISISGASLWLKENLVVGDGIELLTGYHGKQQHVFVRVVRTGETNQYGYVAYGCAVEMRVPKMPGFFMPGKGEAPFVGQSRVSKFL